MTIKMGLGQTGMMNYTYLYIHIVTIAVEPLRLKPGVAKHIFEQLTVDPNSLQILVAACGHTMLRARLRYLAAVSLCFCLQACAV
jgi:hypothetical protein